jgi:hypothetical protein
LASDSTNRLWKGGNAQLGLSSRSSGHLKEDHRMGRNHLADASGDAINTVLAAAGYNFHVLLRWLKLLACLIRAFFPARQLSGRSLMRARICSACFSNGDVLPAPHGFTSPVLAKAMHPSDRGTDADLETVPPLHAGNLPLQQNE